MSRGLEADLTSYRLRIGHLSMDIFVQITREPSWNKRKQLLFL